jgi:hypothetical protein
MMVASGRWTGGSELDQIDDPFPSLTAVLGGRLPWKDKSFKKTLQAQVSILTAVLLVPVLVG